MDTYVSKTQSAVAELEALRVLLALHRYRRLHAAFPSTLEPLVPNFLEALPHDPFDGNPLRYDSTLQRLYSVGPDGLDQGGLVKQIRGKKWRFTEDIVFGLIERIVPEKK